MKRTYIPLFTILLLALFLSLPAAVHAQSNEPVVYAVLFYSPTCPHCAQVIQVDLPPLLDKYPTQLEIVGIDVSSVEGAGLYQAAIDYYQLPDNRLGVPTLIVGDIIMVGSAEIPQQFPGLIEYYLAQGGVDWPAIPGLAEHLANSTPAGEVQHDDPASESAPEPVPPPPGLNLPDETSATWQDKFARDPAGNTLSVIVLIGMLCALAWAVHYFTRKGDAHSKLDAHWLIPVLSLVGLFVAGYLAYVETAQVSAVCGPVGDCNTVQQSEYATLFGILPIGVLGLGGYVLILLAWLGIRYGARGLENWSALSLLGLTVGGTLFSIYLTFLEPFVIGATCAWCLTSAVVMTVLMLLSLKPGKLAYQVTGTGKKSKSKKLKRKRRPTRHRSR